MILEPIEVSERGAFYDVMKDDGSHVMVVGTHTYQQPDGSWLPKTPPGTYSCLRGKHQIPTGEWFDTFEVLGVPGHVGILFVHPGNLPQRDSQGCYICGAGMGYLNNQRDVIVSRNTFEKVFLPLMAGVTGFQLEVR